MNSFINRGQHSADAAATNVIFQNHNVIREQRAAILGCHKGFRGCTIWFTGLSGAGKTTISFALEKKLNQIGIPAYGLDGDNIRHGLCKNLGFSSFDRTENIRRVAEVSKLFADSGLITLSSFISPYHNDREEARRIHESDSLRFFEIYVSTPLEVCESRDPKSKSTETLIFSDKNDLDLYKKARAGGVKGFTGIDSIYEEPVNPDLVLNAAFTNVADCVQRVLQMLYEKDILPKKAMNQLCSSASIREHFLKNDSEKANLQKATQNSPKISLSLVDMQWLQVLAEGWATPLYGFMRERQYLQCLHYGQIFDLKKECKNSKGISKKDENTETSNDDSYSFFEEPISQSIPIVLPIDEKIKESLKAERNVEGSVVDKSLSKYVRLTYNNDLIAVLKDIEVYPHHKRERVHRQFATIDERHPTVKMIMESGDWLIGGDLKVFNRITYNDGLDQYRKTPIELRKQFFDAGCDCLFAFQLRNPIHNGHALLMQETRKKLQKRYKNPMLLLHPLGGWTKDDDVPLQVRIKQHISVMEEGVLNPKWTVLAIFPSPMLYAGPTEVQWHARARLAAGINAYIVGRDPAGIQNPDTGDYLYDPTHGSKILTMAPGLQNLEIVPFRVAAYDKSKKRMAFFDEKRKDDFLFISGTKMREFARDGIEPPEGFMARKAWKILASFYC